MTRVTSKDGTAIAFERVGSGPAVVLVGGAIDDGSENAPLGPGARRALHGLQLREAGPRTERRHRTVVDAALLAAVIGRFLAAP